VANSSIALVNSSLQVQGPRPLAYCPEDLSGTHLDLDQVSLWLMSSENVHGSFSSLFNQQLGLHCLVQHATIFDVSARAFQVSFFVQSGPKIRVPPYLIKS